MVLRFGKDQRFCQLCGREATETHHVFNGAFKKKSEEDGYLLRLCHSCHIEKVHQIASLREKIKAEAQRDYESKFGHEAYMKRYRRSYVVG